MTEPLRVFRRHGMIFGLKRSGKSNFLQWLLDRPMYHGHMVYDVNDEHDVLNRYIPENHRGAEAMAELDGVTDRLVTGNARNRRPDVFAVEEISRFCSPNSPPPEAIMDLVDRNRHYGVGFIGVARRPAQVYSDLVEMADWLIIFSLRGKNDYRRLESEVEGLGDAVRSLDRYEFVAVDGLRNYRIVSPVPERETTGTL